MSFLHFGTPSFIDNGPAPEDEKLLIDVAIPGHTLEVYDIGLCDAVGVQYSEGWRQVHPIDWYPNLRPQLRSQPPIKRVRINTHARERLQSETPGVHA